MLHLRRNMVNTLTYSDLWEELCGLFRLMLFDSWEHMLVKCMENNGVDPPTII